MQSFNSVIFAKTLAEEGVACTIFNFCWHSTLAFCTWTRRTLSLVCAILLNSTDLKRALTTLPVLWPWWLTSEIWFNPTSAMKRLQTRFATKTSWSSQLWLTASSCCCYCSASWLPAASRRTSRHLSIVASAFSCGIASSIGQAGHRPG